jgi:hypothetical protein
VSHTGDVGTAHAAADRQPTQVPAGASQTGVAPVHAAALVLEHAPQAPDGSQAGVAPPQSASPAHARHVCVVVLQTGFVPPHWAFVVHDAQVPVAASQAATGPVHFEAFVAEQTPHAPEGSHAGVAPPHSPSPEHPRHTCVVASHVGVVPPQFAFDVQPTQTPAAASHTEVPPAHRRAFVAEQAPQLPEGWHAGAEADIVQSASPVQARHTRDVRSQTGVVPPQSASPAHATHVAVVASQDGVRPLHFVLFVAEQAPHAPEG